MGAGWGERGGALQGRAHCTGTRALSHSNSLQVPSLALRRSLPEPSHSVQTEPSRPPRAGACTAARPGPARLTRSALCLWPQGARDEDSAAAAAHARPPAAPAARTPSLAGPDSPSPQSPGAWRPARAAPPGPGSAAEVRLGWGATTRPDCGQCPSRALLSSRGHPCSQPPRRAWVSVQPGPGVTLAQPDPGGGGFLGGGARRGAAALPAPPARSAGRPGFCGVRGGGRGGRAGARGTRPEQSGRDSLAGLRSGGGLRGRERWEPETQLLLAAGVGLAGDRDSPRPCLLAWSLISGA